MYEIDTKFFNADGSINTEAACAAGRKAQARSAGEGAAAVKAAAKRIVSATTRLLDAKATARHG
jgi:hypothetical protein